MPPTPRGIANVTTPEWIFKGILTLLGFFALWSLNGMKDDNKDLKDGMKILIEQNSSMKAEMMLIKSNQSDMKKDMEVKYGDHERRLRELELKDARRDGNGNSK